MKKIVGLFLLLSILPIRSAFATADNSFATTTLQNFVGVLIKIGTPFGFNIADYIHPEFKDTDQIATTKYKPFADFKEEFGTRLLPGTLRPDGKIVDWDDTKNPILWTSLYCAVLKASSPNGEKVEPIRALSNGAQKSSNIPDAARAYQYGVTINSMIGLFEKEINEQGLFDFNQISHIVTNISNGDCYRNDPQVPWDNIPNDQVALSKFGGDATIFGSIINSIFTEITELISGVLVVTGIDYAKEQAHHVVELTEKKKTDHSNNNCHDGSTACPENDIDEVETKDLHIKRGWAAGFTPEVVNAKPVEPNAGLGYSIKILGFPAGKITDSDKDFNLGADGQQKASCMAVPAPNGTRDLQARAKIGNEVSIKEKCGALPPVQCPIEIIKEKAQKPSDNACSLSGNGGSAYTNGQTLSPLAIKVIETAADTYHVPASVLVGTMLLEGGFNHEGDGWDYSSDENIEKFSDCNKTTDAIPGCSGFALSSSSKAPFGFLDSTWGLLMSSGRNPYVGKNDKVELEGLEEVLKDLKTFSSCNFADAVFMAARLISEDSSHALGALPTDNKCITTKYGEIPMLADTTLPQTCGEWTAERVATTRYEYGGGRSFPGMCTLGGTQTDLANSNNMGYLIDIWQALTP